MQNGIDRASGMGHNSPPVNEAKRLLGLAPEKWYELELEAAKACGDSKRATQCKYRLWEIEMSKVNGSYARWGNWQGLRTPAEYAKGKWFGKASYAEGMCMADKAVINQPLTKNSSPEFKKSAKDINKAVLGYVGLKKDPRGNEQAGIEALATGARSQELLSELYCQIFKACSPGPKVQDPMYIEKAYDLLAVCMYSFAPVDEELLKVAFKFSTHKDPNRFAKCASHGKFEPSGAPRSAMDISRILGEIANVANGSSSLSLN
jgi:hypothetical protein